MKIAIVGCGAVAQYYYAPALQELSRSENIRVTSVLDPNAERAESLKKEFPDSAVAGSLEELAATSPDLAIVSSPPASHSEQTVTLLHAGISVLCEKPMATTSAEAAAMIDASARSGKLLTIGLFRRLFPSMKAFHQTITSSVLGKVVSFNLSEGGPFLWAAQSPSLFDKVTAGGGVLLDMGSHVLDLVCWWFGEPSEVRYADDFMGGVEANCILEMSFPGGFDGKIRLSRDCTLLSRYFVQFERGWLGWSVGEPNQIEVGWNGDFALSGPLYEMRESGAVSVLGRLKPGYHRCFVEQLLNVVAAVKGATNTHVPASEAARSICLIEHCYRSRKLMRMPWLTEHELNSARSLAGLG